MDVRNLSETACRQGELWGYAYRDWVQFQEPTMRGLWDTVLDAAGAGPGHRLLDAGCGAGGALVVASQRGATVCGVDPSVNMITVARERLPTADLRVGELEALGFPNGEFDAAISINSLQYAANPQLAVHELGRVCRGGGTVVIAVHGYPARSDMNAVTEAMFALFDKRPSGGPFALSDPAALESLVTATAALQLAAIRECEHVSEYPSLEAAVRGMMSAGGSRRAAEIQGDDRVRAAVRQALAPFEKQDGAVQMRNHYLCLVAVRAA